MLVADTNVLSELMRPRPSAAVFAWTQASHRQPIYTTAISRAEILLGISVLPTGKKRRALAEQAARLFEDDFAGLVLPFDTSAADAFARIFALRRRLGRPIQLLDAQIAGIVAANQATLVTRDVADFAGCGFDVLNPWTP